MDLNIKINFSLLDRMAPHQRSSQQASSDEARGFGELKSVLMKEVQTEFGDSKFHNINTTGSRKPVFRITIPLIW